MDNLIPIIVIIRGWKNGAEFNETKLMEANPEETLVSIVDRVETDLDDFRVRSIAFE